MKFLLKKKEEEEEEEEDQFLSLFNCFFSVSS